MDTNKYNTKIRQAISDKLVEYSKTKNEYTNRYTCVMERLANEKDTLAYSEYKQLEEEQELLIKLINEKNIELNVWDMAREICLNITDEF